MRTASRSGARAALIAAAAAALAFLPTGGGAPVFDVTAFGAVGDGVTDDTVAVRAAFSAAAAAGASTVLFPAARTFLTGAFNLSSDLVVRVEGRILAWPGGDGGHFVLSGSLPWFGPTDVPVWQAFIHSDGASNLTLLGGGEVDGNGRVWWACACSGGDNNAPPCLGYDRPRLVHLIRGSGLVIRDLTFTNSPMWHIRPSWFDNVYMANVTVIAPETNPNKSCNTDGIDPDCTQDMLVEDSYVSVGDDAIAIKSGVNWFGREFGRPSRNITFRNMRIGTGHGISIGSEMSGNVTDILFENFVMNGTSTGPRVKSERGRGGLVANVVYRNISMLDVGSVFQVTEYYIDPPPPTNASATPRFANITIDGLVARGKVTAGAFIDGIPESIITGLVLKDCDFGGAAASTCDYAEGLCVGTVLPACPPCLTAAAAPADAEEVAAAAPPPPPGKLFNLSSFVLQLPVAAPGGGIEEVKAPALDTYSSAFFFTDAADKQMTFFCPENGAHTSGSEFPRSELREQPDFDLRKGGFHRLNATLTVVSTTKAEAVTIGQAHIDGISGACSIFIELEWANGDIISHMRDKDCKGVKETVGSGYKLGDAVTYSLVVSGDSAFVSTDRGSQKAPYVYSWLKTSTPVYFKLGNYLQDSGNSATLGSVVKVAAFTTEHTA